MIFMEHTQTCPVCNKNENCHCKQSLAKFIGLLSASGNRLPVSTSKTTSNQREIKASVGIDKLHLEMPVSGRELLASLKELGIALKPKKLKSMWANEIAQGLYFPQKDINAPTVTLIGNPNRFLSFLEFKKLINSFVSSDKFSLIKIKRLDINFDYQIPFNEFLKCVEINGKQTDVEYTNQRGIQTGIRIGKGPEKINIYNKTEQAQLDEPISRIELQLSGEKLPTKTFENLLDALQSERFYKSYLERFLLSDVSFSNKELLTEAQQTKQSEFKFTLEKDSLYKAKQLFNKNNNFERDFKGIIERHPWNQQPKLIFSKLINKYFNKNSLPEEEKWQQTNSSNLTSSMLH